MLAHGNATPRVQMFSDHLFYLCGHLLDVQNFVYVGSALRLSRYDIAATHNPLWEELHVSDISPVRLRPGLYAVLQQLDLN